MIISIDEKLVPFLDDYDVSLHEDGKFYVLDDTGVHVSGPFDKELDAWRWLDSRVEGDVSHG